MNQLTAQDELRYQKIKKEAGTSPLSFRISASTAAENLTPADRKLLRRASTKDVSAYQLLSEWHTLVASEIEDLQPARKSVALRNALSKQLRLSASAATELAGQLVDEQAAKLRETFLNYRYDAHEKARFVASNILSRPADEVADLYERLTSYELHQKVACESGITFYDVHASLPKRLYQKIRARRQIKRYNKRQSRRLKAISARQQELKAYGHAIVSRILLLELDTVLVLDAHRQYKKQLDKLKPENITPAKRLSLFTSATKKIREAHTAKQSTTDKLADLQSALKTLDDVLVELFDMTDTGRNQLMAHLKEYRDLEREAARITKEQTTYAS